MYRGDFPSAHWFCHHTDTRTATAVPIFLQQKFQKPVSDLSVPAHVELMRACVHTHTHTCPSACLSSLLFGYALSLPFLMCLLVFLQTGDFFGEVEGAVMNKLLAMGSFKR